MSRRHREAAAQHNAKEASGPVVPYVAAFWRNDMPGGLGINIEFDGDDGAQFCRELELGLALYDEMGEEPAVFVSQLEDMGAHVAKVGRLDDAETLIAFANIYWLQKRGHIRSDEYNGLVFFTRYRGVRRMIEGNPVTKAGAL